MNTDEPNARLIAAADAPVNAHHDRAVAVRPIELDQSLRRMSDLRMDGDSGKHFPRWSDGR